MQAFFIKFNGLQHQRTCKKCMQGGRKQVQTILYHPVFLRITINFIIHARRDFYHRYIIPVYGLNSTTVVTYRSGKE